MESKCYRGARLTHKPGIPGDVVVFVAAEDGAQYLLPHAELHSPTGFEWGYGGAGPADLAYSILVDYLGDATRAEALHQTFKRAFIAPLDRSSSWTIEDVAIAHWLAEHKEVV